MGNRLLSKDEIAAELRQLDDVQGVAAGYLIGDNEITRLMDGRTVRYTTYDLTKSMDMFSEIFLRPLIGAPRLDYGIDVQSAGNAANLALKNDTDKDPWHLAPWDAFRAIVKVMAFGAKKYSERNWEKGFDWHRLHRAAIEHLTSWWEGEDKDPETGYSHLWHAGCCVTFLIAHEIRGIGKDDRPKKG